MSYFESMTKREREIMALFEGSNHLTPYIIRYGETKKYVYEFSHGRSEIDPVYGVTVRTKDGERLPAHSTCFCTRAGAEYFIGNLQ